MPTTVAEPPACYDRLELPGIELPWAGVPVELGEGRGTGLAVFHAAGSADIWNGGPVSLVAWEDGRLILTHGDFAAPDLSVEDEDIRPVRLSGNVAEDLLVHNHLEGEHFTELLVLEGDRWVLAETKTVMLPVGFDFGVGILIARHDAGMPVFLLGEEGVGFHRLAHGEDAWLPTGEVIAFPSWLMPDEFIQEIEYGDVDGDGDEDVLLSFYDNGQLDDRKLALLRAEPSTPEGFVFERLDDLGMIEHLETGGVYGLLFGSLTESPQAAVDLNGDGQLDILMANAGVPSALLISIAPE